MAGWYSSSCNLVLIACKELFFISYGILVILLVVNYLLSKDIISPNVHV